MELCPRAWHGFVHLLLLAMITTCLADMAPTPATAVDLPSLIAQVSIDAQIDGFIRFLGKILLVVAIVMVCWSAFMFHDGKVREGIYALVGAFILAIAVPAVKALFGLGGGWNP